MDLTSLAKTALRAAQAAGADETDVLGVSATSVSIDVRGGALEQAERSEGTDIGLRVIVGQRQAVVSSSDVRSAAIEAMAERAVAMAREAPQDPNCGLADPSQIAKDIDIAALDLTDPTGEPEPAALEAVARAAEASALAVSGVSQVQSASAAYEARDVVLVASNGFEGAYRRTGQMRSCVAISGEGLSMEREYDGDYRVHGADLRGPEEIGQRAGQRAVERAGARKPPTGAFPVVFDERIAASLVGHLLETVNGAAVARGSGWLRDAIGHQVLPSTLSLREEPLRPRGTGSRPFDAEGLATGARDIVNEGVLTGWTLDLASARKLGFESTANAARSPSGVPSPSVSNIALTQGDKTRAELLSEMGTGLLVTGLIGASINPNTGDYSRGASGFWVENGQITYPVNECTLAGNLRDMLMTLEPANDARPWLSRVVPSLRVEGLTLAGE